MLIQPDCIPCILKMTISVLRRLPLEEEEVNELYSQILKILPLSNPPWDRMSAELVEIVMQKIVHYMGDPDPFYSEKLRQNKIMLKLYPQINELIEKAPDPLYEAVKLAGIGNAIDFMFSQSMSDIEKSIKERLRSSINQKNYEELEGKLKESSRILYLGDNAGEIVMDRLLIERIRRVKDMDITFVVRSRPTLNDVTRKDAEFVGIDRPARVIENGIDGPLPGTILKRCSNEMKEWIQKADLIISKGGANHDTMDEETDSLHKDITFLLLSKCYPYQKHFNVPLNDPILANVYKSNSFR